ncbi:MAG: HEPN domain-containing protein [Vulcanisaeta sp.]|jgi:HEPN domain-containing protein|uniref:HEPN domain-containing protein n=1 Tax=Vulcanisaeta sp. TaxID=2020871 RepID=UPI003D0BBD1D
MNLPSEWIEKGDAFLKDAENHVNDRLYWLSCFEDQQAAELYLKGFLMARVGTYPFTHDLAELLRTIKSLGVDVPMELYLYADALSGEYTLAKYPGRELRVYNEDTAVRCVEYARRLIEFVKSVSKDPG